MLRHATRPEPTDREPASEEASPAPSTVLDLLDDPHARSILRTLEAEPLPARELVDRCESSRPTVYRRLDRLEAAGLVDSRLALDPDGHHHREFSVAVGGITLDLDDGELSASPSTVDRGT